MNRQYPTRIERHQAVTDSLWSILLFCIRENPKRVTWHLVGAIFAAVLIFALLYLVGDVQQQGTLAISTVAERMVGR